LIEGLSQLTREQLWRVLEWPHPLALDTFNYDPDLHRY
jgi:hypothetical protein